MKKVVFLYVITLITYISFGTRIFCDDSNLGLSVIIQPSLFIAPKEFTNSPTLIYEKFQASLLNNIDALGLETGFFGSLKVNYFFRNNIKNKLWYGVF